MQDPENPGQSGTQESLPKSTGGDQGTSSTTKAASTTANDQGTSSTTKAASTIANGTGASGKEKTSVSLDVNVLAIAKYYCLFNQRTFNRY